MGKGKGKCKLTRVGKQQKKPRRRRPVIRTRNRIPTATPHWKLGVAVGILSLLWQLVLTSLGDAVMRLLSPR